jgi:hypothetical protein
MLLYYALTTLLLKIPPSKTKMFSLILDSFLVLTEKSASLFLYNSTFCSVLVQFYTDIYLHYSLRMSFAK